MYNTTSCYKTESDLSVFFSTIHNLSVEKMHTVEIKISFNSVLLNEIEVSWPLNALRWQDDDHLRSSALLWHISSFLPKKHGRIIKRVCFHRHLKKDICVYSL